MKPNKPIFTFTLVNDYETIVSVFGYEPAEGVYNPFSKPENQDKPNRAFFDYSVDRIISKLQHKEICSMIQALYEGNVIPLIVRNPTDKKTFDVVFINEEQGVQGYAVEGVSFEEAQEVLSDLQNEFLVEEPCED